MIIYYLFMEFPTFYIPKLRLVARFVRDIMIAELRAGMLPWILHLVQHM